jgi:iron complex outermembrane recepter protein
MARTSLAANASYFGEQVFDGDETNTFGRKMPAYTLVDVKLATAIDGWQFNATVRNLLNQKYFSYGLYTAFPTYIAYPAAERNFFVSAQYQFH